MGGATVPQLPHCSSEEARALLHLLPREPPQNYHTFDSVCRNARGSLASAPLQDKVGVKALVATWAPELPTARLLAAVNASEAITSELVGRLPRRYIVKGAHGSGMTVIVRDNMVQARCFASCSGDRLSTHFEGRERFVAFIRAHCRHWLGIDYSRLNDELAYSRVPKACVFEEWLGTARHAPDDLKVFTFRGRPLMLLHQRQARHKSAALSSTYFTTSGALIPGGPYGCANVHTRARVQRECALIASGASRASDPRGSLPVTKETLQRAMRTAAALARRSKLEHVRIDLFVLSPTALAFAEFTPFTAGCGWGLQPAALNVLLGRAALMRPTPIASDCLGDVVRVAACHPHSPWQGNLTPWAAGETRLRLEAGLCGTVPMALQYELAPFAALLRRFVPNHARPSFFGMLRWADTAEAVAAAG